MTIQNREAAITETLKWEGGYSNVAADPGGPTNWGITIADARKYWKKNATASDVKSMPKDIAIDIYRSKYWKTPFYDCDKLASGVDLAVFDFGVNSGPSRAKKALDASVGGTAAETVNKICDQRMAFLRKLGTWPTFGTGWTRRVVGIRNKSIEMTKLQAPSGGTGGFFAWLIASGYFVWHYAVSHPFETAIYVGASALMIYGLVRLYKRWKRIAANVG